MWSRPSWRPDSAVDLHLVPLKVRPSQRSEKTPIPPAPIAVAAMLMKASTDRAHHLHDLRLAMECSRGSAAGHPDERKLRDHLSEPADDHKISQLLLAAARYFADPRVEHACRWSCDPAVADQNTSWPRSSAELGYAVAGPRSARIAHGNPQRQRLGDG